jgi:hypothetical protein
MVNLESMNAEFIRVGLNAGDRLTRLNLIAIQQLKSLSSLDVRAIEPRKETE